MTIKYNGYEGKISLFPSLFTNQLYPIIPSIALVSMKKHTKNPNRVAGAKKAWTLMRTRKWQNAHKDSLITQTIKNKAKSVRQANKTKKR